MKIKICGIKYKENLTELIDLQPDYIGFIFYPKSKRFMVEELTPKDLEKIPPEIKKVGVFVNEEIPQLLKQVNKYKLDAIQVHGDERPEYLRALRAFFKLNAKPIEVFKAFGIDDSFNMEKLNDYKHYCDYFLFDTKTPKYGGSGEKFNWKILSEYDNTIPIILSGGIGWQDIESIKKINDLNLYAIDLNSKLEIEPGLKDIEKARSAVKLIRKTK